MLVKFIITYFLLENTNSINLEFEDFPLLHNTSLQACVIGEVFMYFLFLIKNYQIKQEFFIQALEILNFCWYIRIYLCKISNRKFKGSTSKESRSFLLFTAIL